jgi:hypothetical protein
VDGTIDNGQFAGMERGTRGGTTSLPFLAWVSSDLSPQKEYKRRK